MRVSNEILSVLDIAEKDGNALRLVGQLDRTLYTKVNKVLEVAGGKWSRKSQAHIFDGDAADAMELIILTGEITAPQDFGFFPTPETVVSRLIMLANITEGMQVLEPSAGNGAICDGLSKAGAEITAVEILEENFSELLGKRLCHIHLHGDFLDPDLNASLGIYDRIVMNPPFAKQADIKHVLHALRFLKPDGLLVSVMAASVVFRDNKLTADFRDLVRDRGGEIEALPEDSFKSSGTRVNTVIVTIPAPKE